MRLIIKELWLSFNIYSLLQNVIQPTLSIFLCQNVVSFVSAIVIMVSAPKTLWCMMYYFYFWLHEWTLLPIHSKLFLDTFKLGAHGVSHNLALPCLLCASPGQWRLSVSAHSAAAGALLAAILRHFWKEVEIRVPHSPSVYTHSEQAVTEWMRESQGDWGSLPSLPCILTSSSIPTYMLPVSCSFTDLWILFLLSA